MICFFFSLWTSVHFCDIVCATTKGGIHMMRKRQVNSKKANRAVLNREFPRQSRSLFITEVRNEHH